MNIFERQRAQLREVLENEIARGKAFLEENKKDQRLSKPLVVYNMKYW
jgi:hypothetical protein